MATKVFKTKEDSPDRVEIAGVGLLGENGLGGVKVEEAAKVLPELQVTDDNGNPVIDEETGAAQPLTGKALDSAAKDFADSRGFRVVSVADDKAENMAQELGYPPDPELTPAEASKAEYERIYGGLEPVNTPEQIAEDVPVEPSAPASAETSD